MTGKLIESLKQRLAGFTLIPSRGGCFEVTVDGDLIYSKLATGEFPDEGKILDAIVGRMKKKG